MLIPSELDSDMFGRTGHQNKVLTSDVCGCQSDRLVRFALVTKATSSLGSGMHLPNHESTFCPCRERHLNLGLNAVPLDQTYSFD